MSKGYSAKKQYHKQVLENEQDLEYINYSTAYLKASKILDDPKLTYEEKERLILLEVYDIENSIEEGELYGHQSGSYVHDNLSSRKNAYLKALNDYKGNFDKKPVKKVDKKYSLKTNSNLKRVIKKRKIKKTTFSNKQKVAYYKKRLNDNSLTPRQRGYAKWRLTKLI